MKEGLKPPLTFDILRDLCACACLCFGDVSETREAKAFPKPACREASKRFDTDELPPLILFNCLPHIPSFWVGSCLLTPARFFQTSGAPLAADGVSVQHTRPVTTKRAEAGPGGRLSVTGFSRRGNREDERLLKRWCKFNLLNVFGGMIC